VIGLVIVTHGQLATELRRATEHVVGEQTHMATVCIGPDDDMERRRDEIRSAVRSVSADKGVIALYCHCVANSGRCLAPMPAQTASRRVTLVNKRGLHARASAKFVACVERYQSTVEVTSHNDVCAETVEADSIMELLMLGSACGEDITITAKGEDAVAALDELAALVEGHFGEGE